MKRFTLRKTAIAAALAGAALIAATGPGFAQMGGYGMGPGMMGGYGAAQNDRGGYGPGDYEGRPGPRGNYRGGYGPGYGMGPGMMGGYGPGYGMGPGMMGGYGHGYGMGPGMMWGYGGSYPMGPGMMGAYGHGYGMGPGMMWGYGPGYGGIDLNDKQREQLGKAQQDIAKKHWDLMGKMHDEQYKLSELYAAPKRDDAAIEKSFKRMEDLRREMFDSMTAARKQADGVLTPEQKDRLRRYQGW